MLRAFVGLDLNLLTALWALLDTHSVTLAAQRVGVTQSAMSRTLGRLRQVFDDPLFLRKGRVLEPTARALALREPLDEVFGLLEHRVLAPPQFDPASSERRFRIVGADVMDLQLVPGIFRALRRAAPHAALQVLRAVPEAGAPAPDLMFAPEALEAVYPELETLRGEAVFEHRFVSLVRAGHPALGERWDLDRYLSLEHVLVSPMGGSEGVVDEVLAPRGLRRRIVLWTPDFTTLGPLLEETELVVTLPETQARYLERRFAVVRCVAPLELPVTQAFMYWFPRDDLDPGHRWFRDLVRRVASPGA